MQKIFMVERQEVVHYLTGSFNDNTHLENSLKSIHEYIEKYLKSERSAYAKSIRFADKKSGGILIIITHELLENQIVEQLQQRLKEGIVVDQLDNDSYVLEKVIRTKDMPNQLEFCRLPTGKVKIKII